MIWSHYLNKIVSLNTYYSSHRAAFEFKLYGDTWLHRIEMCHLFIKIKLCTQCVQYSEYSLRYACVPNRNNYCFSIYDPPRPKTIWFLIWWMHLRNEITHPLRMELIVTFLLFQAVKTYFLTAAITSTLSRVRVLYAVEANTLTRVVMLYLFAQTFCHASRCFILSEKALCRALWCSIQLCKHSVAHQSTLFCCRKHFVARDDALSNRASITPHIRVLYPTAESILSRIIMFYPVGASIFTRVRVLYAAAESISSRVIMLSQNEEASCRASECFLDLR